LTIERFFRFPGTKCQVLRLGGWLRYGGGRWRVGVEVAITVDGVVEGRSWRVEVGEEKGWWRRTAVEGREGWRIAERSRVGSIEEAAAPDTPFP
jgi:hypothetical protein